MTGGLFMGYKTTKPTSIIHITGEAGEKLMEALQKKRGTFDPKKATKQARKELRKEGFYC